MSQDLPIECTLHTGLLTCVPDTPLYEVARHMAERRCNAAVIMEDDQVVGLWTEHDRRQLDMSDPDAVRIPIRDVMHRSVERLPSTTPIGEVMTRVDAGEHQHALVVDAGGQPQGIVSCADKAHDQDTTSALRHILEQRDQALAQSRRHLELSERVIDASLEGIIITDAQTRIEFVNPAFTHMTGYSLDDVIGRTPAVLSSGRHDADFYKRMWKTLQAHGYWRGEIWNRRKSGQLYLELLTITAIRDEQGNITHFAALFSDITHIRENEEQVRRRAYYDALTHLPNRRLLEDRLALAIRHAHRHTRPLAVIFIDLDHFKQVNDALGYAVGDELLLQVTQRLSAQLSEDDTLARLGGDEFIALLPTLETPEEATRVARKMIEAICAPFELGAQPFRVGCSLGISLYPDDGTSAKGLIRNADAAMYRAKQEGRNTYRLYRSEMQFKDHRQLAMETALRDTAETGAGLMVYLQPLFDRDSGALRSAEALLRWQHPEFGHVSPADFIPLAERSGLILPLGERLMQQVADQLQAWRQAGLAPVPVAINLSARQFWQHDLAEQIRKLFEDHDLPSGLIGFELTESTLLDQQQQAIGILNGLRELGCFIAIDDFGTGYSSLSYLQDLPVTTLKVDRVFIQRLGESRGSNAILAAVTSMARELGLRVVAEGVETEAQLDALKRYPVHLIQGFLTGRPTDTETFASTYLQPA